MCGCIARPGGGPPLENPPRHDDDAAGRDGYVFLLALLAQFRLPDRLRLDAPRSRAHQLHFLSIRVLGEPTGHADGPQHRHATIDVIRTRPGHLPADVERLALVERDDVT